MGKRIGIYGALTAIAISGCGGSGGGPSVGPPPLSITNITPTTATTHGGTKLTITGTGFTPTTTIAIVDLTGHQSACTSIKLSGDLKTITAITPAYATSQPSGSIIDADLSACNGNDCVGGSAPASGPDPYAFHYTVP